MNVAWYHQNSSRKIPYDYQQIGLTKYRPCPAYSRKDTLSNVYRKLYTPDKNRKLNVIKLNLALSCKTIRDIERMKHLIHNLSKYTLNPEKWPKKIRESYVKHGYAIMYSDKYIQMLLKSIKGFSPQDVNDLTAALIKYLDNINDIISSKTSIIQNNEEAILKRQQEQAKKNKWIPDGTYMKRNGKLVQLYRVKRSKKRFYISKIGNRIYI